MQDIVNTDLAHVEIAQLLETRHKRIRMCSVVCRLITTPFNVNSNDDVQGRFRYSGRLLLRNRMKYIALTLVNVFQHYQRINMDFEEILVAVKPFGKFQKRFFALTLFVIFPTAIIDIMFAFTQYETSFHCALPTWINVSKVIHIQYI